MSRRYRFFEVVGVEVEYPTVDADDLSPRSLVEPLFRRLAGRPTSEVECGAATFSNELADHVFEAKTARPEKSLIRAEKALHSGIAVASKTLRAEFGARLLPTGMHPLMNPATGRTWSRSGRRIYETYAKLFDLGGHGWMNVQSCHLNFPFGSERETVAMHNAMVCLLPYLPALTASSPVYEGKLGPHVDNRLTFYRHNQKRFPLHAGDVIPEYMEGYAQYRRDVLQPIYRSLAATPEAAPLRHEWINSRGAIVRFMRDAVEIRVLDTQECVRMDIACAVFVRAAVRTLTRELLERRLTLPDHRILVADYDAVVAGGSKAAVAAPHLRAGGKAVAARRVLHGLRDRSAQSAEAGAGPYLDLVKNRIDRGNLSELIRSELTRGRRNPPQAERIRALYSELADCLDANEPWKV